MQTLVSLILARLERWSNKGSVHIRFSGENANRTDGFPAEEYQSKKATLLAEPNLQRVHEFDNRGEINADHVVARPSREG